MVSLIQQYQLRGQILVEGMSVMLGALATPSTVDHHWGLWGGGGGIEAEVLSNKSYIWNTSEKPALQVFFSVGLL